MTDRIPFSIAVRERSRTAHDGSEHSGFMDELLQGKRTREDYVALAAQHWYVYQALEAAAAGVGGDPIAAGFLDDALTRLPALEADLAFLIGADWRERIAPLPATQRYVARIAEVGATWPGGFVAHHYTRYLGDLSGGFHIGRMMRRQFGFDEDGVRFYIFDDIADPTAFKDAYRARLDAAAWTDEEHDRVIDEVLLAYRFNTELFDELALAPAGV